MTKQAIHRQGNSVILYDESVISHLEPDMFSADYWADAEVVPGYSGGRGATLFVSHRGDDWVLKHYYRGGLVGKVLEDEFIFFGIERVRSVAEWQLLKLAHAAGLPVPVPVAAHFERRGFIYAANLITRRIPGVAPFSTRLASGPATQQVWHAVGHCVRQFHDAGFYHADLSAHNLQIDSDDRIWLLDWDRGRKLPPGKWQQANLDRLLRSCRKIRATEAASFSDADWQALLAGYKDQLS